VGLKILTDNLLPGSAENEIRRTHESVDPIGSFTHKNLPESFKADNQIVVILELRNEGLQRRVIDCGHRRLEEQVFKTEMIYDGLSLIRETNQD
jgi:hypothetical protein